jgi:hypothetical protein
VPDAGASVTVNVTDCPETDGLSDEVTVPVVAVEVFVTTSVPLPFAEPVPQLPDPPVEATVTVNEYEPAGVAVVVAIYRSGEVLLLATVEAKLSVTPAGVPPVKEKVMTGVHIPLLPAHVVAKLVKSAVPPALMELGVCAPTVTVEIALVAKAAGATTAPATKSMRAGRSRFMVSELPP